MGKKYRETYTCECTKCGKRMFVQLAWDEEFPKLCPECTEPGDKDENA